METIIKGLPPNIEEIYARFPDVKGNDRVVYTHYPHIYKQVDLILPDDLVMHEATHLRQQEDDSQWWDRYLKDDEFLLSQEIEAYGTQYAYTLLVESRQRADRMKDDMAITMASEVYGNIISFSKAESKIRHYAKTVDKDTLQALTQRISVTGVTKGGAVRDSDEQSVPEPGN